MPGVLMTFPNGKHKALTMSYDDGKSADRKLVELFNRYGIKGTFHINSGLFGEGDRLTAGECVELYRGHEVSVHTLTHPTLERCPKEQIIDEIMEDRRKLEETFGYPVRGMSYPNGSHNRLIRDMLPYLGMEYARVVPSTHDFAMPDDWHAWKPTCHHNDSLPLAEAFLKLHKQQYLYLMYVWGHSYEFDLQNNWDLIESFCRSAGGRDDIWYATNIEIVEYVQAFRRLVFSASRHLVRNPSATPVWLRIDGEIVEVGAGETIRLDAPRRTTP